MASKFRGPELVKKIDKALDNGLKRFIINTQSKLSASSPVDSGRLASSWFVNEGQPSRETRPESWAKPGDRKVQVKRPTDPIIYKNTTYWISNSLPYAEIAALDPGYVGRRGGGRGDWYTSIINNLPKDSDRAFQFFLKQVR